MDTLVGAQPERDLDRVVPSTHDSTSWPVMICLLGSFHVLQAGRPLPVRGGKSESLLCYLALHPALGVPGSTLREALWPASDAIMAGEALHSRVYNLHKLLGPMIGGAAPVVHTDGCYKLNDAAGIGVDVSCFDALATSGDRLAREGRGREAAVAYQHATQLYNGDLCVATDLHAVVERERLRARYLDLLATLAADSYGTEDDAACLAYAGRMLQHDPCREDAHRLIMRCYLRRDQRAQALHQFRVCQNILRAEFDAAPEPATVALFEQIRLDPASVASASRKHR